MARYGGLYEERSLPLSADINLINLVDVEYRKRRWHQYRPARRS
jgi:hypothetical protein